MTYEEAEQSVKDNLSITGKGSKIKQFDVWLRYLIIVPSGASFQEKGKIFEQCISNGYDNKKALITLNLFDKDYQIELFGEIGGITQMMPLADYLRILASTS